MGQVTSLPFTTFKELVDQYLLTPVELTVTKADLMAMDKTKSMDAKATGFLVPAAFPSSPSPRRTERASSCHLVVLDVDDPAEASRMLKVGFPTLLGSLGACVYHTARSTEAAPRLRVVVHAEGIPIKDYASSVKAVAGLLGMQQANRESLVPVQPMFRPVIFSDELADPIVYANPDGDPFLAQLDPPEATASPADDGEVADLANLRAPIDGIRPEDVAEALSHVDSDCPMQQWIEVGMGLKHQFGAAGYEIWDQWSSKAKTKYPGEDETKKRWDSFKGQTEHRKPITVRSVLRVAEESGWKDTRLGENLFIATAEWIGSPARSTEELLDKATVRIAKASPILGTIKTNSLMATLARTLKARGIAGCTSASIGKEVRRISDEAAKAARDSSPPLWANHIVFVTASNLFYRYLDNRKMRPEVVDLIYQSPDPETRVREYLIHQANVRVVENLRYDPSTTSRIVTYEGVPYCNTYRATYPAADLSQMEEVGDFMLNHAQLICGSPYFRTLIDFSAYQVQKPGSKVRWVPVIQSGVGAGKGLWAAFMTAALGVTNVQRLAAEHVLEATYNGWASGSQLTVLDEVRIVGANRHRVMDKLKPSISDDFVSVRDLYEPVQTVPNTMNFVMFTNYPDALAIHSDDRRYFYVKSPIQTLADVKSLGGDAYFNRGYGLVRTHAAGIRAFLENWPISPDFAPEGRAPVTPFLRELAQMTASPLSAAVQDALDDQPHPLVRRDLVSIQALRAVLGAEQLPSFTDQGLGSVLRDKGFIFHGRHLIDGFRHSLWASALFHDVVQEASDRQQVL